MVSSLIVRRLFATLVCLAALVSTSRADSTAYNAAVLADSPKLFYKFNEAATCTTITDYGSAGVNGSATSVTCGSTSFKGQTSASFNGTSSVVSVASALSLNGTSNPTTLEFWALMNSTTPVGIFDSGPSQTNGVRNFDVGQFSWQQNGNGVSAAVPDTTAFHQYVIVFYNNGGAGGDQFVDYYQDGAFVTTENTAVNVNPQTWVNPWAIGNINAGANGWFSGKLIGFAVFPARLSAGRVLVHFNAMNGAAASSLPKASAGFGGASGFSGSMGGQPGFGGQIGGDRPF